MYLFLKPQFLYVENGHACELNCVPSKFVEILTSTCIFFETRTFIL